MSVMPPPPPQVENWRNSSLLGIAVLSDLHWRRKDVPHSSPTALRRRCSSRVQIWEVLPPAGKLPRTAEAEEREKENRWPTAQCEVVAVRTSSRRELDSFFPRSVTTSAEDRQQIAHNEKPAMDPSYFSAPENMEERTVTNAERLSRCLAVSAMPAPEVLERTLTQVASYWEQRESESESEAHAHSACDQSPEGRGYGAPLPSCRRYTDGGSVGGNLGEEALLCMFVSVSGFVSVYEQCAVSVERGSVRFGVGF